MFCLQSLIVVSLCCTSLVACADDWPQWMGPERDNVWRETGIVDKFPDGGPKVLWRPEVAGGNAGPAVAGGKVFSESKEIIVPPVVRVLQVSVVPSAK